MTLTVIRSYIVEQNETYRVVVICFSDNTSTVLTIPVTQLLETVC